jgi:cobalt-zinc-cadmium efflux system protein
MGHDHTHSHNCMGHDHHSHGQGANRRVLIFAIALNLVFIVIEAMYGFLANSTALLADAGHNLSDVLGLIMALTAIIFTQRRPSGRYTFGLGGSTIIAALGNAVILLLACGAIAFEAAQRLVNPPEVAGATVMIVAAIGILINGLSAWVLSRGPGHDLNMRGAYLHMLADMAVSVGVVMAGAIMITTGWVWVDPLISLIISFVIIYSTWGLLKESLGLALNAAPREIDIKAVESYLRGLPGVTDIHDLHIWAMSTTQTALIVHLVMPGGYPGDTAMDDIARTLEQKFGIAHSTLQMEQGTTEHHCHLSTDDFAHNKR